MLQIMEFLQFYTIACIVSNLQVKQHCYFNQFIAINDKSTSNHLTILANSRQVKLTGDQIKLGRKRDRERMDQRQREI
jgi:hypothetical protein